MFRLVKFIINQDHKRLRLQSTLFQVGLSIDVPLVEKKRILDKSNVKTTQKDKKWSKYTFKRQSSDIEHDSAKFNLSNTNSVNFR